MKKIILLAALALSTLAAPARAGVYYDLRQTISSATLSMVGRFNMFTSTNGTGSPTLTLDSISGGISATGRSTFTATGATVYSIQTSSGINIGTGGLYAAFIKTTTGFFGTFFGSLGGGGAGQLPYQSAANTTAFLAAGADTQALVGGAAAPAWSTTAGSTVAANVSGLAARATKLATAPTLCSGQASTGIDVNGNAQGCFSAGTGDVVAAGTTTMSGYFPFTSSTTIGPSALSAGTGGAGTVISSTLTYNSVVKGGWATVAYSTFVAASAVHFYNFSSSYTYRITGNWTHNTSAGNMTFRFQGDTGANYYTHQAGAENFAGASGGASGATALQLNVAQILANTPVFLQALISCPGIMQPNCTLMGQWYYNNNGGAANVSPSTMSGFGNHKNIAGAVTTFSLQPSAATMTGYIFVEVFVPNTSSLPF